MKKQFFRVKQLADQTFLRAEKSEILNHEELQIADQKTEFLRGAITSITKKIAPSGPTNDSDKLMKKCFEYQLGTTFIEESKQNRECQLFPQILRESGLIEQQLAKEYAEHEMKVEEMVFTPLQNVLENDFPNILKHKHTLRKYSLDKDSASSRYHATRKEGLKEDMEEADTKVEQSRDVLATEMFNILAKENEFSEYILQLLKLQRGYHESAIKNLETIIPQLEKKIGDSPIRRVFGTALQEHLRITDKKIAYPLEICIPALSEYGLLEEGLFRVAASVSKVKRLKSAIDSGCFSLLIPEYRDAHVLASILKLYLRELPEPLLTFHLQKEWLEAMQHHENQRLGIVKKIIDKLPHENKVNLSYLIQFLSKLTQHPENKMSSSNIAIILSPNLLWIKNEKDSVNIGNCVMINMLIELFIKEVDVLFPDDMSNYVSLPRLLQDEDMPTYNKLNTENTDVIAESPRPNMRKKKSAPIPPNNENKSYHEVNTPKSSLGNSAIIKSRNLENVKVNVGINTDDIFREKSNTHENSNFTPNVNQEKQRTESISSPIEHSTDISTKVYFDKKFTTVVSHPINQFDSKRILPDQQVHDDKIEKTTLQHQPVTSEDNSKRKDVLIRVPKPEVPARPLSLSKKPPTDTDAAFKKTHCSVYNTADKLHPSIINIQTRSEVTVPKHEYQIVEKEKLLETSDKFKEIENKLCDMNSYCSNVLTNTASEVTNKNISDSNKTKSNEHLNVHSEKLNAFNDKVYSNQKTNHVRARSDGGVIDIDKGTNNLLQVSRSCSKPTQPPPPPPDM